MSSPTKYEESGKKYDEEPEIVAEAVPAPGGGGDNETPVPAGHSRFYCSKCHTVSLFFVCFASSGCEIIVRSIQLTRAVRYDVPVHVCCAF